MDTVLRPGQTNHAMKVIMPMDESMALEATSGMMAPCTQVIGVRIKLAELVSTRGLMVASTRASGSTTTWKVWVSISGTMAACTRDSTRTIRNTDLASTHGQTSAATRATGSRASSMDSDHISCPRKIN